MCWSMHAVQMHDFHQMTPKHTSRNLMDMRSHHMQPSHAGYWDSVYQAFIIPRWQHLEATEVFSPRVQLGCGHRRRHLACSAPGAQGQGCWRPGAAHGRCLPQRERPARQIPSPGWPSGCARAFLTALMATAPPAIHYKFSYQDCKHMMLHEPD